MGWIDRALGVYPEALVFRSRRSEALASNIANADTPGYLARDYDFRTALNDALGGKSVNLTGTHERHIGTDRESRYGALQYRLPTKAMNNGNSVEAEVEQAAFSDNAVRYQASLAFLNGTINGLKLAIKGE